MKTKNPRTLAATAAGTALALGLVVDVAAAATPKCNGVPATIVARRKDVTIVGTASADVIVANGKANVIHGLGGDDIICGAGGDDVVIGGEGDDRLFGGTGDDTLDGGAGVDALAGDAGDDVLDGGPEADTLNGGGNADVAIGGAGGDEVVLGSGDDRALWRPGDGSDVVDGQGGADTLEFVGANTPEAITLRADGQRLQLTRDVSLVTLDVGDVESVRVAALGGADRLTVGDLAATPTSSVELDLSGPTASGTGDAVVDDVVIEGTERADGIRVSGQAGVVTLDGLAFSGTSSEPLAVPVTVLGADADDHLRVHALGGDDAVDASAFAPDRMALRLEGGLGVDLLIGSAGDDVAVGGDGNDVALLNGGDDVFVWNPGDDDDVVEGQAGFDTLSFNGANAAEHVHLSANGGRVQFFRNVANVVMDTDDVEEVEFLARGGADTVVVDDLSGTDVVRVSLDLAAAPGTFAGDAQPDTVIVGGTAGDDVALVVGDAAGASVLGLAAQVNVVGAEAANDRLVVNLLAGDDVCEASGLAAGAIQLTSNGGADDDILVGGAGNDVLVGGEGDDVLIGGPGSDVLNAAPGDDVAIQG